MGLDFTLLEIPQLNYNREKTTVEKEEKKEKKVSHQGSPNFKLLIHRQSSSAPKAFCYCHCPEDFAQEFEEQKNKTEMSFNPHRLCIM